MYYGDNNFITVILKFVLVVLGQCALIVLLAVNYVFVILLLRVSNLDC